jgi:hypothetical protein
MWEQLSLVFFLLPFSFSQRESPTVILAVVVVVVVVPVAVLCALCASLGF